MKNMILTLASMIVLSFAAKADEIIKYPIKDGGKLRGPIKLCKPTQDKELSYHFNKLVQVAQQSFNCGQLEEAAYNIEDALSIVEELQARNARGYCYSQRNCRRPKVSAQLVTKAQCKATGIAESWKPTNGACVNL